MTNSDVYNILDNMTKGRMSVDNLFVATDKADKLTCVCIF